MTNKLQVTLLENLTYLLIEFRSIKKIPVFSPFLKFFSGIVIIIMAQLILRKSPNYRI